MNSASSFNAEPAREKQEPGSAELRQTNEYIGSFLPEIIDAEKATLRKALPEKLLHTALKELNSAFVHGQALFEVEANIPGKEAPAAE